MPRYTLMGPILNEWENIALFSLWVLNTTTVKFGGLNTLIFRKYFRQYLGYTTRQYLEHFNWYFRAANYTNMLKRSKEIERATKFRAFLGALKDILEFC